jgi:hypothetical protein
LNKEWQRMTHDQGGQTIRTVFYRNTDKSFIEKFYNLRYIPRIGEEVTLKGNRCKVANIVSSPDLDEIIVYVEEI